MIIDISAYRLAYINIKDIIVFATLKIKDIYNSYYKSIFFKVEIKLTYVYIENIISLLLLLKKSASS